MGAYFSADFDDNTWQDITLCQRCAGLGCPSVDNGSYMNTDWMRLCISGGQLNSDVKVEYDLEVSTTEHQLVLILSTQIQGYFNSSI